MFLRERSYWASLALTSYAGASAYTASAPAERPLALLALGLSPLALGLAFTATAAPTTATDRVEPGARAAARTSIVGALLLAESMTAREGTVLFAHLGAALASIGGVVATARASSLGGLASTPSLGRRLDGAAFGAFAWTVAVVIALVSWLSPERTAGMPMLSAYAGSAAAIASLGILLAASARVATLRKLELGLVERLSAVRWLGGATLAVGIATSALGLAAPEKMLPIAAALTGVVAGLAASTQEVETVSRTVRHALALVLLSTPPALTAAFVAKVSPDRAASSIVLACALCAAAGMAAPRIARRAAPQKHLWLDALEAATAAALSPDPDPALEQALLALRPLAGTHATATETLDAASATATLYKLAPAEAVTADRAGFVHRVKAEVPDSIIELARSEPDQVLRRDVLETVAVRMPEVRSALVWMKDRHVDAVALLLERDEPVGLLALPRGDRTSALGLEEVRAFRALSDRLAAVVAVSSKLGRSWDRERLARESAERDEGRARELANEVSMAHGRIEELLARAARPARVATYSPAARTAVERLESLAASANTVTMLAAPGIDALAYAALVHLAGPMPSGPFVIVEGSAPKLTDLMLWRSDASPIVRAQGGTLVLLHPELLPKLVQSYIGAAADERLKLCVVVAKTVDVLVAKEELDERFADRVGDDVVALPTLASRAEDLRALALEHLGTLGVRFYGRPLGIEPAALGLMAEYGWPGNDAELLGVLTRAATSCDGHLVRRRDIQLGDPPTREGRRAVPF